MINTIRFLLGALLAVVAHGAFASANGVVISQVYGGGGNSGASYTNDFIELFNAGSDPVSLSGWSVQYASATGSSWAVTSLAAVALLPGQYYLIQESTGAAGTTPLPAPDATGSITMSATAGKVALLTTTTALSSATPSDSRIVDLVGFGSTAGFFEGTGPTPGPANATAVLRAVNGCTDTNNNATDFSVGPPTPRNRLVTPVPCGTVVNAPIISPCASFAVAAGTGGMATVTATDADGIVNQVSLTTAPFGITLGTLVPATTAGGTASVPIVVSASLPAGTYPTSLTWLNNQSQSAICTPTVTVMSSTLTPIYTIQGAGSTSPVVGQSVTTRGVVTRVTNNGFYLQDPTGDGNDATSDAIFVFTSTVPTVAAGNLVQVSATVTEFNTGAASNADTAGHTITELSSVGGIVVLGTGFSITPLNIAFPAATREDLERYEHMLVTITGPLTVAQTFFVGQYGQLTLAAQGQVESPTNRYRPGAGAQALLVSNKNRSFVLEDGSTLQYPNPTPFLGSASTTRAGDTVTSVTGVLDYGLATNSNADPGSWRIVPTVAPVFTRTNPRTAVPDDVGGTIKVGAANVLNFFTTFTNGQTAAGGTGQGCTVGGRTSAGNCRGADNITEFNRQRVKIVAELSAINADVFGIMEMQNNGSVGVQNLVDGLNAALGAGTYAAIPDPLQGTGTDAIKVVMIYKPARLARVGDSVSDPHPIHNRPPLAQTFAAPGGQQFTLVVNHLKSKTCGGATGLDTDQGDLQSCFNATRVLQARQTRAFVASLSRTGKPLTALLVGDFNSLAQEDPIVEMTSNGYVDEIGRFNTFGYSYGFDGASGRLDHALTTPGLSVRVTRASEWHINADEPQILDYNLENKQPACATCSPDYYAPTPYRASDHDPVVIGLSFDAPPTTGPTRPVPPVITDGARSTTPAGTDAAKASTNRAR